METCEISDLPIPMVPRLHQSNGYIKKKLRVRRPQKCNPLVGAENIPVREHKLPCFKWDSKGPRMEICEISGLLIPMVPHLHQSNGYIKRKLHVWRAQKFNALVSAQTILTSAGPQTTPFHGSIGPRMEICETSGLPISMVPHLHQSNGYIKRKLRVRRSPKCKALLGAQTILTSAGPQTTPFHVG